ncbi:ABC transporter permease [uncultured Demequina sp.]|uniref:ABC transporter permease n=1 Tax=uncultured Demequina sp. TaxID=693499 RepID=UPI0025CBDC47|nr:ABC transporter permease [uncultured Demequina sp.]
MTRNAQGSASPRLFDLLRRDRTATVAAVVLCTIVVIAFVAPPFLGTLATDQDLYNAELPPFTLANGWEFMLGSDTLGRSVLARLIVATQSSLMIAVPAITISLVIGGLLGLVAGYRGGWFESAVMRFADIVLSFPSLVVAVFVLYVFSPTIGTLVLILALTRLPVYIRTARSAAAARKSRTSVDAARSFGLPAWRVVVNHLLPSALPTMMTLAAVELCTVMLAESALSFLGIGLQPPDVSLGLMVSQGREELRTAWWLTVFPGAVIVLITVSANLLANWLRLATDPGQRWRLTIPRRSRATTSPGASS